MPLKLSLQSNGPGRGLLLVQGQSQPVESVNLALRRNDGQYLGRDGAWQPTAFWHPQFGVQPGSEGMQIELGAALMDPIVALHGQPLLLTLRLDDHEDSGVPRIRGALIGSDAAPLTKTVLVKRPQPPVAEEQQATPPTEQQKPPQQVPAKATPPAPRSRWVLLGAVLVLSLIGGGLGTAWSLGWLDAWIALLPGGAAQEQSTRFSPAPDSALTGRAFATELLAGSPSAERLLSAAEARLQAGDCDAALILYARAVDTDATLGVQVARRYDPASFTAGGCIDQPNEDIALGYLRTAAEAGVPAAMQRVGELLIERADSGPVYDEGRMWLQRARAAESETR
ncbi:MAG: hypothetical protein N838_23820 [Thiohalocapsa sp. PB-PSB1]|jgi:hypothetical protein|nr:MAG: hypothetical protein N838_32905 [Thiohalocapsa sp. PB-PSB1]QQO55922.1 MAG: hypothetical protein N838_23820 [Thiohalocapsa sp. PB-PSB1]